jgi:hypothetical protein
MEIKANVQFYLSPLVDRPEETYASSPAIFDHIIFGDGDGSLLRFGENRVTAWVDFRYEVEGSGKRRVMEFYAERKDDGDPKLPIVVVLGAGKNTWCGTDVEELGCVEEPYGAVAILRPGTKTCSRGYVGPVRPNQLGGILLGSWLHRLQIENGDWPIVQAVTAPFHSILRRVAWARPAVTAR